MPTETLVNPYQNTKKSGEFQKTSLERENFVKRANALKAEGQLWYPAWRDLSTYINPTKGFFLNRRPNVGYEIDHKTVLNEHPQWCADVSASGMQTGLTSPSQPWFKLGLPDPDLMRYDKVKLWLDEVQQRMYDIFSKSNIYTCLHSIYGELITFGTACMFVEEDYNYVIRGRVYTAGEYYLGISHEGKVNAFYRRFWMTVEQMVQKFGLENLSPSTQTAYKNNQPDTWVMVNFLVEFNDDRVPFFKDFRNMEYRAIYWEDGADATSYLRLDGYEEFPILAPRWETVTTADVNGRGPGWKALGSAKMLQKMERKKLIALDKVVEPPIQVDTSVQGEVNTMPGGVTRFSALLPNAGVKPAYQVNPDLNAIEFSIEKTEKRISKFMFTDLFLMIFESERQGKDITATEIIERKSERLGQIGPVLERLEGEDLLGGLINRTYNIMERNGLIPRAPEEIRGMPLKVQYISVLAQAQKMAGISAIDHWTVGVVGDAGVDPDAIDIINFDEKNAIRADMLGVPTKMVNSPDVMALKRKQRAEELAKQKNIQATALMAEAAAKGGKAVKDTATAPMHQDSALDGILGAITGGR